MNKEQFIEETFEGISPHGNCYGKSLQTGERIRLDRNELLYKNGLVFGQSGSGKRTFIKGEIAQSLVDGNKNIIVIDSGNEYSYLAEKAGGQVFKLFEEYHINPLDFGMEWSIAATENPLKDKANAICGIFSALNKNIELNSYEKNCIHRCTERVYRDYIEEMVRYYRDEQGSKNIRHELCPTLMDFYQELLKDNTPEGAKLALIVDTYQEVLSHRTDIPDNAFPMVINLSAVPTALRPIMKYAGMLFALNIGMDFMSDYPLLVYVDGMDDIFSNSTDAVSTVWKKAERRYNTVMTGTVQDAADVFKNKSGLDLFNATGFIAAFSSNPAARRQLKERLKTSEDMVEYLCDDKHEVGTGLLFFAGRSVTPFKYEMKTETLYAKKPTGDTWYASYLS